MKHSHNIQNLYAVSSMYKNKERALIQSETFEDFDRRSSMVLYIHSIFFIPILLGYNLFYVFRKGIRLTFRIYEKNINQYIWKDGLLKYELIN